jgi:hypothetical protein
MKATPLFCARCNRKVQFLVSDSPTHEGHANIPDERAICLECGEACGGQICPVTNTSGAVMQAQLDDLAKKYGFAQREGDGSGQQ